MKTLLPLLLTLLLASCGDDGGSTCEAPAGSYLGTFAERSGDCGPFETILVMGEGGGSAAACSGVLLVEDAGCIREFRDYTCSADGASVTYNGRLAWDGEAFSGVLQLGAAQAGHSCLSTYDVLLTPQG